MLQMGVQRALEEGVSQLHSPFGMEEVGKDMHPSSYLRTSLKSETRVLTMPKMWQWCISACNIGQVLIM